MNRTAHVLGAEARTTVALVARREIGIRMHSRPFLLSTLVMLLAIVGGVVAAALFGPGGSTVGVTDPALARPLSAATKALGEEVEVRTVADEATGTRQVRKGTLDALVTGSAAAPRLIVEVKAGASLQAAVTGLARQAVLEREIARAGGDPAAIGRTVTAVQVDVRALDPKAEGYGERVTISMAAGLLVYLTLLLYGQAVAQGVIEEKSSRIVELLLSVIRPWQLMLGKVLGIGAVGLLQMLLVLGTGVAAALAVDTFTVPSSVVTGAAVWALVWFLIGFLMYALMFAAAGALVSRQEEANSVVTPITTLIIIPYLMGVIMLPENPDGTVGVVASMVPFFSPALMPMRMAYGAPVWQVVVSLTASLLLIVVLVWLAGRVYGHAVLRTGARIKVMDAFRNG